MAIDTHDDETAARALITAAEADTSPAAQRLRGVRRLTAYIAIVYVAAAPIFFGVSLWRFGQALLDGNWISFWFAAIGVVPLFLPSLFLAIYDPLADHPLADRNPGLAYICLYDTIASGDEALAPVLPISKASDATTVKMKYVQVIGELSSARVAYTLIIQVASVGLLLFLVVWMGRLWPVRSPIDPQTYLPFMIVIALSVALGITSMFFALSQAVGYTVTADESGLSWRTGVFQSHWIRVSWDEVRDSRRFAQLDVKRNKWEHDAHAYLLDLGNVLLIWGVIPFEFAAGGAFAPKEIHDEWERFAVFISTRTNLPLRDITPATLAIAHATGGRVRERKVAQILLARPRTAVPVTILGLQRAVALVAEQENPQRLRLLRTLAWIPLALFVALYIIGAIIQFHG